MRLGLGLRRIPRALVEWLRAATRLREIEARQEFILWELARINRALRWDLLAEPRRNLPEMRQTRASFDYQWDQFNTGASLAGDRAFMDQVAEQIVEITDTPRDWFQGKRVVDVGCGAGRFSHGLLRLGAEVTACDQSPAGLEATRALCKEFGDRLRTRRIDLLDWEEEGDWDMAFSFGVVHHTGNTYLAIRNVCAKVRPGGRLFLMVYGVPRTLEEYRDANSYERLRSELASLDFDRRRQALLGRFGAETAHGWFDAVSPQINDLVTEAELRQLLGLLGFGNVRLTRPFRNLHVAADRVGPPQEAARPAR